MVSFDGHLEGTPLEVWRADGRFDRLPVLEQGLLAAPAVERILVVVAHADDETLGCGGTIALARRLGTPVDVVIVTDGAAAHGGASADLADERRHEAEQALARLGDGIGLAYLEVPDSATPDHRERIVDEVRARATGPAGSVLLISTWARDGHRDHRVVGEICAEVAAELGHPALAAPIWLWHWADPAHEEVPWPELVKVELDAEAAGRKRAALDCYRSQTAPGPGGTDAVLHPLFLRTFAGGDRLVRVRG
ncbi:PIG-L family deacetylase [Rathayibacter sp. VKM Ac-2803]|uniref:PIG-L deacetylase family protein n=1 Tax=Rathayibacter sp. VKM Ac-2803 TaxID=2609256 RepID=UPI001358E93C|nr:PIG-L deacetylase family protein [Rathayibacter sp. VKM Ac-2803]MWV49138.1 PIG-L family deacetylase [Rathayibacter sp. VKM Ac-2803]